MFPAFRRSGVLSGLAFLFLCLNAPAHGQDPAGAADKPFVVEGLGHDTVALSGPWQFHTGDDLAWASPNFNDSGWEQIDIGRPWGDQGHWSYSGPAWYRRQINWNGTPQNIGDVALFMPETGCAYEVYWNGRLIGATDAMPTMVIIAESTMQTFRIGKSESGLLALRVSTPLLDSSSPGNSFGISTVPRIGTVPAIENLAAKERAAVLRKYLLKVAEIVVYAQLALLALLVWRRNRKQKLLFWVFAFLLSSALWTFLDPSLSPWLLDIPLAAAFYGAAFHTLVDISLWYLLIYLLELSDRPTLLRWTRNLAWLSIVSVIVSDLCFYTPLRDQHVPLFQVFDAVTTAGFSIPGLFPLVLVAFAFKKQLDPSRRFVALAALLADMYFVVAHAAEQGERYTRWTLFSRMTSPLATVYGVEVTPLTLLSIILSASIVYAVYRHTLELSQRQASIEQEFLNARAVQQVLIPDEDLVVPGFSIHSVYKPFGEVGGDFFQVLAIKNGGVLAVIGDVSGKGMPAAMTVSLLIGTARTLAYYTQHPREILFAMNLRMVGRSQGGFTTCLVVRLDPDGTVTTANAGHIAPYLAGRELTMENGLPLGISPESTYPESVFRLDEGEQLTLITDGVVEARDLSGSLFGFERTESLSNRPAETISSAAQQFGQDDDITVLTLTRQKLQEPSFSPQTTFA